MLTVKMVSQHDYWLEDETGSPFPASFLQRDAAELCAVLLNRENVQRVKAAQEPIHIVLESVTTKTPRQSLGGFPTGKQARVTLTLDGYAAPKNKELVIATKDEAQPEQKPEKIRVEL